MGRTTIHKIIQKTRANSTEVHSSHVGWAAESLSFLTLLLYCSALSNLFVSKKQQQSIITLSIVSFINPRTLLRSILCQVRYKYFMSQRSKEQIKFTNLFDLHKLSYQWDYLCKQWHACNHILSQGIETERNTRGKSRAA